MTDQTRPMDTKRIAEIRARVEAATPGPWEWDAIDEGSLRTLDPLGDAVARKYGLRAQILGTGEHNRKTPNRADTDFIAHSRQDIPDLLAELSRLRAVIEEARARIANRKFGDNGTRIWIEDYMDDLGRLLDRGLKGAGDDLFTSYLDKLAIVLGRGQEEEGARFGDMPPVVRAWVAGQSTPAGALLNALDRGLKGVGE